MCTVVSKLWPHGAKCESRQGGNKDISIQAERPSNFCFILISAIPQPALVLHVLKKKKNELSNSPVSYSR